MHSLNKRLVKLEGDRLNAGLKAMTDDELRAYTSTLENGSSPWWDAVMARVMRNPRTFPVVPDDPDHAAG